MSENNIPKFVLDSSDWDFSRLKESINKSNKKIVKKTSDEISKEIIKKLSEKNK